MSIAGFDVKEQWIGTSDTSSYNFDFKISDPSQLHIYVQDPLGNILEDIDGTDDTFLAGVTFDPINGGGTITTAAPFANQNVMTIFLANDLPDQPSEFKDKASFELPIIEGALDFLATQIQRVAFLAQRSARLHDLDDIDGFDMRLPQNLSSFPSAILTINQDGNGFSTGASFAELIANILAAQEATLAAEEAAVALAATAAADAAAAAVSAAAALTAANAAASSLATIEAEVAAATIMVYSGPFAAIAPNASLNLPGEVTNSVLYTQVDFIARIKRGTTVYARQEFSIFYRNGAWEIAIGPDRYADAGADHSVTFTCDPTTGQINAAVANDGGSNAVISLNKIIWTL